MPGGFESIPELQSLFSYTDFKKAIIDLCLLYRGTGCVDVGKTMTSFNNRLRSYRQSSKKKTSRDMFVVNEKFAAMHSELLVDLKMMPLISDQRGIYKDTILQIF